MTSPDCVTEPHAGVVDGVSVRVRSGDEVCNRAIGRRADGDVVPSLKDVAARANQHGEAGREKDAGKGKARSGGLPDVPACELCGMAISIFVLDCPPSG
jgi:hypothetical protein